MLCTMKNLSEKAEVASDFVNFQHFVGSRVHSHLLITGICSMWTVPSLLFTEYLSCDTMLREQPLNTRKDNFFIEMRLMWFIFYVQLCKFIRASLGEEQGRLPSNNFHM
jgi:hypothetical protein